MKRLFFVFTALLCAGSVGSSLPPSAPSQSKTFISDISVEAMANTKATLALQLIPQ